MILSCFGRLTSLLAILLLAGFSLPAQETASTTLIAEVIYMKSTPGADIAMLEGEVWAPIHRELMKAGHEYGWSIYYVSYPSRMDSPYDYIAVNYYTSPEQMDWPEDAMQEAFAAAHPGKSWEKYDALTSDSRDMVFRELYVRRNYTSNDKAGGLGQSLRVNYMKTKAGQREAYLKMEDEIAKPMHQAAMDQKALNYWGVWEKVLPWGANLESDFVSTEEWVSPTAHVNLDWVAMLKEVHPNMPMEAMDKTIEETRTLVRGELWSRRFSEMPTN